MIIFKLSFLLIILVNRYQVIEGKFYSAEIARERLVTDLFVNYDAGARPTAKEERLDVSVNIELQHFDFRETDGAFNFVGLLQVSWRDPKLAWNPSDYNNLTVIPVTQKVIWVPDIEVYNNAADKFFRMHKNGIVLLKKDGHVLWTDTVEFTAFCTTNMRDWPKDKHDCKLSLGSWTYDGFELDILNDDSSMNFDNVNKNTEYEVISYGAARVATLYQCCAEPYITMDYNITFRRRTSFVYRVPALSIIMLSLLSLIMEPWRGEKILLNTISFVIIIYNLIYFANSAAKFARTVPLVVVFYTSSLVVVTLMHLVCVFALFATRSRYRGKLPLCISEFLRKPLIKMISPTPQTISTHHHHLHHDETGEHSQFEDVKLQEFSNLLSGNSWASEWVQLAKVIERIALIIFGLTYLILASTCFV